MGADWNRSGLREMDRHERWAKQVRQAAQSALQSKEFDRSLPGRRTRTAAVAWASLSSPDEKRIQATAQKYVRAGWEYVARKEALSFFGLCNQTILTFQSGLQARKKSKGKSLGCLMTLVLIVAVLVIGVLVIGALG